MFSYRDPVASAHNTVHDMTDDGIRLTLRVVKAQELEDVLVIV
jgi:hypothetical protein